jgi:hypothetical protein
VWGAIDREKKMSDAEEAAATKTYYAFDDLRAGEITR